MSPFPAERGGEVDVGEKDCNIVICAVVWDAVLTVPRSLPPWLCYTK
jgi:hypothetical protein